ncbi:hypothetical protein [Flavobacterium gyeonganense]|uniref:Uncharacterized protein n=1 Tax=Flavobacterium gyeonganense TaxID=1310418 RepID=A0ABV5HFR1_9FLAO|nr:hypothetical protein [Flavobacterium gyeonganense]
MKFKNTFPFFLFFFIVIKSFSQNLYVPNGISGVSNSINNNVGIGVSDPKTKFEINGDITLDFKTIYLDRSANREFYKISNPAWNDGLQYHHYTSHKFFTLSGEVLRIQQNGNIGIGVSDPQTKLEVNGDITLGFKKIYFDRSENKEHYKISNPAWDDGLQFHHFTSHKFFVGGVERLRMTNTGLLDVYGSIRAEEVKVCLNKGCDFVFENDYPLLPLNKLDEYIKANKHLPEIAPAAKMESEGINLSEMNAKLLLKVEELTLYVIEQNKKLEEYNEKIKSIDNQSKEIEKLKEMIKLQNQKLETALK